MTKKRKPEPADILEALPALRGWFESQGLNHQHSAYLCAVVIGSFIGLNANDENHLENGIIAFSDVIGCAADDIFERRKGKAQA